MEPNITVGPKLPDMIMCGDHPAPHPRETESAEKEKEKDGDVRTRASLARISPTSSRERAAEGERAPRPRDAPRADALVRAALGGLRWPPYLVCVWLLVLLLTHALHCVVALLERALPALRSLCRYFRAWTEESWRRDRELERRLRAAALGGATALLYAAYGALAAAHALALWALEPPGADEPDSEDRPRVTTYAELAADAAARQ